jgi:hypothetical protein
MCSHLLWANAFAAFDALTPIAGVGVYASNAFVGGEVLDGNESGRSGLRRDSGRGVEGRPVDR